VQEVEAALDQLINHEQGPFIVKMAREPGQSACRYAHLFSGEVTSTAVATIASPALATDENNELSARVDELEQEVTTLKAQLTELQATVAALTE